MKYREINLSKTDEIKEGDEVIIPRFGLPIRAVVIKRTRTRALVEFEGRVGTMRRWVHYVYVEVPE